MKLLVFAHTPPPHHGQSYMVKLMLDGLGGDQRLNRSGPGERQPTGPIECYHVNAQLSEDMEDIGVIRYRKGLLVLRYCAEAIWCRFRYGLHDFYYVPAPGKRGALYRDWTVMLLCRPFFKRFIYHWHAVGMGDWLHREGSRYERWITNWLMGRSALSVVLAVPSMRDALWFKARQVEIVPNGIPDPCPKFETEILPRRRSRTAARKTILAGGTLTPEERSSAGGDPEIFKVLYLAHCTREKGIFDTPDAVALANAKLKAANSGLRIHLTVAGAFLREDEEKEFQARLALPDLNDPALPSAADYAGFVSGEQKERLLRESDCFCFPTFYPAEGQPVNLIEAMAFGLLIVTTPWRGIPEIVPAGFPFFVEPEQPPQAASMLIKAAGSEASSQLRAYFLEKYTLKIHLEHLKKAFLELQNG